MKRNIKLNGISEMIAAVEFFSNALFIHYLAKVIDHGKIRNGPFFII